jgi:hypothetical protein
VTACYSMYVPRVTKKYWRRSAACCLVETTVDRIACRKHLLLRIEISGSHRSCKSPRALPLVSRVGAVIFFLSHPRRRAGQAIGLGYYQGARPPPSRGLFGEMGPRPGAGGRQSGLPLSNWLFGGGRWALSTEHCWLRCWCFFCFFCFYSHIAQLTAYCLLPA